MPLSTPYRNETVFPSARSDNRNAGSFLRIMLVFFLCTAHVVTKRLLAKWSFHNHAQLSIHILNSDSPASILIKTPHRCRNGLAAQHLKTIPTLHRTLHVLHVFCKHYFFIKPLYAFVHVPLGENAHPRRMRPNRLREFNKRIIKSMKHMIKIFI